MGAEIDESSMTTGAVGDNTGCVGRRAVEGWGSQGKRSMQCSASGAWCVGGRCGGRGAEGKLVIARIFSCSLVVFRTDCDISREETLQKSRAEMPVKP